MELKKINVLSLGKIAAIFGAITGLLVGILSMVYTKWIIPKLVATTPTLQAQFQGIKPTGFGTMLISIVMYAVIWFIAGMLTAWIYNISAKKFGGIGLDFKK